MDGKDFKKIHFGVDYYPEHWPPQQWPKDAEMMIDLGVQVVRLGEFSWHKIEPREGVFCFNWLDEAINILGKKGILSILGTPTAAPPAWLIEKHTDILPVNSDGMSLSFGGRHHDCMSNPIYREYIKKLVTAMAVHFKDNPYVIGWQIDNELGNSHYDLCMCNNCRKTFQKWLEKKYATIEKLNVSWGTDFWSQNYDDFSQIPVPRKTPTVHNPSLLLDWRRFTSDLVIDFQKMQIDIIRSIAPNQKITHNLMGLYDKTDYYLMSENLDFASNDQYPTGYYFDPPGQSPYEVAACMDFIRSVKDKNFWMMEMESGPTGGSIIGPTPRPGQNKVWTAQSVAHGADTIMYFRWRTCLFGAEQFWHGILPHDGKPGRIYKEIKQTIQELKPMMDDCAGIVNHSEVGILFSYDEEWAIDLQPQNPGLTYSGLVLDYYKAFYDRNVPVNFLPIGSPQDKLSDYQIIIAPLLYLMSPGIEEKLFSYVKSGGTLVLTMRTGVMDVNNKCMAERPLPGKLSELAGVEVEEYDSLYDRVVMLSDDKGENVYTGKIWCDILHTFTANTAFSYQSEYYKGKSAVTKNSYGKGTCWYVGTVPDEKMLQMLSDTWIRENGLSSFFVSEGIESVVRHGREHDYQIIINHLKKEQTVRLAKGSKDEEIKLKPYDVKILSYPKN